MRKSTLFISAALTAFMLAVLFGVVSAYQNMASSTELAAQQAPSAVVTQVAAMNPAQDPNQAPAQDPNQDQAQVPTQAPVQDIVPVIPALPVNITPEQATAIASSVLGRTDLYSVEITQLNGVDVYLVTFSSGDLVYISMDGQVVSISKLPVTVITKSGGNNGGGGNGGNGGGNGGGGNGGSSGGGEHEGSEHEGSEHEGSGD